ncbi:MAG: porin [Pseudomonadota bacterium]
MKKRMGLCGAFALLGGVWGGTAAHAQSSVLLYGVMDMGLQRTVAGGNGAVNALSSAGLTTSRIGFRGTEDLGGGLAAGFMLEGSLNPDTGTGRATNSNNQASGASVAGPLTFDRESYVSLSGSLGEVRLGREFSPTHYNSIAFDPFNANGVARAGNFTFAGVGSGPLPTAVNASNSVSYWLPKHIGGFYGMALAALGENASTAPNPNDGRVLGARFGYASGPFDVAAAATRTRYASTTTVGDYTYASVGGTWDLGVAKLFALYNVVTVDLSTGRVKKNTAEIGAHISVGDAGRIRLSYARLDDHSDAALRNGDASPRSANDASQFGIGYVYTLSKRSALYGTYGRVLNHGQATYAVTGGSAPAPGLRSSGLEFGVRHLF